MLSSLRVNVNNTGFAQIIVFSMLKNPLWWGEIPVTQGCSSMTSCEQNHLTLKLFLGFNSSLEQVMEEHHKHPCGQHLPFQPFFAPDSCVQVGKVFFLLVFESKNEVFLHFPPTPPCRALATLLSVFPHRGSVLIMLIFSSPPPSWQAY